MILNVFKCSLCDHVFEELSVGEDVFCPKCHAPAHVTLSTPTMHETHDTLRKRYELNGKHFSNARDFERAADAAGWNVNDRNGAERLASRSIDG